MLKNGFALNKQMDISNLLHLREEGYSNAEIARQLDISEPTVFRYLGRNPPEIIARVKREAWDKRRDKAETALVAPKPMNPEADRPEQMPLIENRLPTVALAVSRRAVTVAGVSGIKYIVENGKVWIADEQGRIKAEELTIGTVRQIVAELMTILRHADETDAKNQIWD